MAIATSSYAVLALTWPGLLLLALIYYYGFRVYLMMPMVIYLVVISLQGYGRFRLVLPAILLCQIFLDRRGRRWPGVGMIALLVALALLFFPLKAIGREVQAGGGWQQIVGAVQASFSDSVQGRSNDQAILDHLALTLSLTDNNDKIFLGRPYLNIIVLPVPRSLWPDKPGLADHIQEISTSGRPLGQLGGVTTLVGDFYLNFRLPGLLLLFYLLARLGSRLHRNAYANSYFSVQRFIYLLLAVSLIQVYRDGLISVPLFLLVQNLPLIVIVALHWQGWSRGRRPLMRTFAETSCEAARHGRPK